MSQASNILQTILQRKAEEIIERAQHENIRQLSERAAQNPHPRPFIDTLRAQVKNGNPAIIAEIKKASPSKGVIRPDFDPVAIANSYSQYGATCLSILTDKDFFQGSETFLQKVRAAVNLPILRKDFIIDPYQVYESKAIGADCILLIVAALGDAMLAELFGLAQHLEMDVLVEVHDHDEMQRALAIGADCIGINNRDLKTFATSLETTLTLKPLAGDDVLIVTESGIKTPADVQLMQQNNINTFLVGETFMRAPEPGEKLYELFFAKS